MITGPIKRLGVTQARYSGLPNLSRGYIASIDPRVPGGVLNPSGLAAVIGDQCAELRDSRFQAVSVAAQATGSLRLKMLPKYVGESGYLYCPGVSGNYASTPDSSALDITGDIRIRALVDTSLLTTGVRMIQCKWSTIGANRSWTFALNAKRLEFRYSPDGTNLSMVAQSSTDVATGLVYVEVTRAAATGVVKFETSQDGVSWTQLGTTVSTTVETMFSGAASLEIGSRQVGTGDLFIGKILWVEICASITGADVRYSVDFRNQPHGITSITATSGQTVTINQSGVDPATVIAASVMRADGTDDDLPWTAPILAAMKSRGYGSLWVTCWDTLPSSGSTSHYPVHFSVGTGTGNRIGISTRDSSTARDVGIARTTDAGSSTSAVGTAGTGMRVLGVIVNWAAGTIDFYRNGVVIASNTFTPGTTDATDSQAGGLAKQASTYFGGDIGPVSIFAEAGGFSHTTDEIRAINVWHAIGYNITIP